jgi:hypothetical protein
MIILGYIYIHFARKKILYTQKYAEAGAYFPGGLGGYLGGYSGQHPVLRGSCRAAKEDSSTN